MEVGLNQSISPMASRKWLGIIALLFAFFFGGSSAFAATPTPSPTGDIATTFILGGKIADCGVGIPGIKISVTGPGTSANLVTDKKGVWEVQTPTTTRYLKDKFTVTLDKTTLPKDRVLIGSATRTVVFLSLIHI